MTDRTTLVVDALGSAVAIEFAAVDADAVRAAWSGASTHTDVNSLEPLSSLELTVAPTVDAGDPLDLATLSTAVTLAAIGAQRGTLLMLHACGLARSDGAVAAFVAASGTGKTTLARALGQHLGYVSDETVGITADGTVLAYRKPLSIIREPGVAKVQESPSELGLGGLPTVPLRIASVTVIERDPELGAPTIERMRTIDAIAAIVPQTSYLADFTDESGSRVGLARLAALGDLIGGFRRVRYRESSDLVAQIDALFAPLTDLDPAEMLEIGVEGPTDEASDAPPAVGDQWQRAKGTEWIDDGERVATFVGGMFHTLDGVGAALWRALGVPTDLDHLTSAVVAELGPAPNGNADRIVAAALTELNDVGLVRERARLA